jgi:WD40 repeat protein/class 3 adenylate cyclase/tRNA A-37 threonylcarbamoyl transferase component Bud32
VLTLFKERYEVLATIGSGGEAQVVKALDRQHDRLVALKIRPVRDEAERAGLLTEARTLLALPPHPALPLVREDFFDRGDYVVAMDWVDGTDLATLLGERGRPGLAPSSVLAYLAQAAEALTHLHAQSPPVIHGDVKPANLILTRGGRIKLVDFGLSSAPGAPRLRIGTPGYRAPELAAGGAPSRASDVYALAATAFALLTGAAPAGLLPGWDGIEPGQAERLESAIRAGMATDPVRRPRTPGELVERLRAGWEATLPTGVVTFCSSEIKDAAALWDAAPEAMAEALVRHDELIASAVEARGGTLIKAIGEGDATLSVFDAPARAAAAVLAAQRALAAEPWPGGLALAVRWGLHTGEVRRSGGDHLGPSPAAAGRVRAEASGGQVLLSATTAELVRADLPADAALVDLGPHALGPAGAREHLFALRAPGIDAPPPATACPYRGLLAFEAGDAALFFGREEIVADLAARVRPGRLLAVVGASGSGKSSVLRAGLIAAVRTGEVEGVREAVLITPGAEPVVDVPDDPARLLVVDQFEELFVRCPDPERRAAFADAVLARRGPVAIGMRADLYGRLGAHPELARAVACEQVLLGAMTSAELERAVTEPARLAGLRLEPGLAELIVRNVAAEPGALPLLSHALRATWAERDGRTLTVAGYRASGGVASAIARTAEAAVDALTPEQRPLARGVFVRLTELGEGSEDSRRRVRVEDLVPAGVSAAQVDALLERLADARLVTLGDGTAEVAHEALIRAWPRLRGWLEEDRAGLRAHRQLGDAARLWDAGGRASSDLYRGARLDGAVELASSGRVELNATERAFLDAAVAESEGERRAERRTNRRLRGLLAGALVLLALAVVAGIVSLEQRGNAREAEAAAERQALGSDAQRVGALALSAPRLELSLLYALAGVELDDRLETRSNLLTVLQRNPAALRTLYLPTKGITALAAAPGGSLAAVGDDDGTIRFLDTGTWRAVGRPVRVTGAVTLQGMAFSPDGRTLAVTAQEGLRVDLSLVDVAARTRRPVRTWERNPIDGAMPSVSLAYAPGGHRLAVALPTNSDEQLEPVRQRLFLVDARTGRTVWQRRHPMRPRQWETHVVFTPTGQLVTSSQQGETIVWDARAGRIVRRFPVGGRLALAPDGHTLALALNSEFPGVPSSAVALLDLRTGHRTELRADLPEEWITALVFTPDGSRLVGAAFIGTHVWDVASGAILETYGRRNGDSPGGGLAVVRGGVALTTPGDGVLDVWDVEGRQRLGRYIPWGTRRDSCGSNPCAVIDPSGRLMATGKGDGRVVLVDLEQGRRVHTFPARDGRPADAYAFTPEGLLVTGGAAGTVTLWNVASRTAETTLDFDDPVRGAAYAPQGRRLAVVHHADGAAVAQIEVRELPSGARRYAVTAEQGVSDLHFSPDGRLLVALDGRSRLVVWDARTGARRFAHELPDQAIVAFAILPDSRSVLVGTEPGAVARWELATGRRIGGTATVSSVAGLAVTPDGERFAVGSYDGTTTLWDVRTLERIGESFPVISGVIPALAFDPAGRLLITNLGFSELWTVDPRHLRRVACRAAGRELTRDEWADLLPGRSYRRLCA